MFSLRRAAPIVALTALGLVGATAATASQHDHTTVAAAPHESSHEVPIGNAVGGDVGPPVHPSLLNTRLTHAEEAMERLGAAVDHGDAALATAELNVVTANMSKAWRAAVYIIQTAPPPVAGDDAVNYEAGGPPTASPEQGAYAVMSLQHDFVTTGIALLDSSPAELVAPLRSAIEQTSRSRSGEINYIKSIQPPPVATEDSVDDQAMASGTPVSTGWGTLMQDVGAMLADENQLMTGTRPIDWDTSVSFQRWKARNQMSINTIDTTWPPVPAD